MDSKPTEEYLANIEKLYPIFNPKELLAESKKVVAGPSGAGKSKAGKSKGVKRPPAPLETAEGLRPKKKQKVTASRLLETDAKRTNEEWNTIIETITKHDPTILELQEGEIISFKARAYNIPITGLNNITDTNTYRLVKKLLKCYNNLE